MDIKERTLDSQTAHIHAELINLCRAGDRQAQYKVYNLYVKSMFNTAFRIVGDHGEASDVVQEAFIEVFTKMERFREESSFGYWLKQIVTNRAISALRKSRNHIFSSLEELSSQGGILSEVSDTADSGMEDSTILLEVQRIKTAIERLPEGYKLVITLYLLEGYDHEEISEILGISEATSRTQFMRGKRKLLQLLAEREV